MSIFYTIKIIWFKNFFIARDTLNGGYDETASKKLIFKLMEENEKLARFLEKTINERNMAQNRALINEQIVEQNTQFEEEIVKEYEDKIENLQCQLKTKENIIHELEILKSIP